MKKMLSILTIFSVLLLSFPFAVIANDVPLNPDPDNPEAILNAGQTIEVGGVEVWNDADTLYAQFITEGEWCMTEVHLQVGDGPDSIPQTQPNQKTGKGGGNPIPGHFAVNETFDECTQESPVYPWDISGMDTDSLVIAAHAVVSNELGATGTIYGTRTTGGTLGLYEIDVLTDSVNLIFKVDGTYLNNTSGYTNALAYDSENNTLYFTAPRAVNITPSPLWSYVPGDTDATKLCDLTGSVVGASWYDGYYHYIAEKSNKLMKVTSIVDGICETEVVQEDFGEASEFTFGDFAISKEGILYGSTRATPQMFFSLDLNTGDYHEYEGSNALDLQLAYGSNGVLYGTNHGNGKFYKVNEEPGMATELSLVQRGFADLASGTLYEYKTETAWAGEVDFAGANWARYFRYEIVHSGIKLVYKDPSSWEIVNPEYFVRLKHNEVGSTFDFSIKGTVKDSEKDYTLIFYPDPWPGNGLICLGDVTSDVDGKVNFSDSLDTGDLPATYDENYPEGAKIWLVSRDDVDCSSNKMLHWNPTEYLYESDLIKYENPYSVWLENKDTTTWEIIRDGTYGRAWYDPNFVGEARIKVYAYGLTPSTEYHISVDEKDNECGWIQQLVAWDDMSHRVTTDEDGYFYHEVDSEIVEFTDILVKIPSGGWPAVLMGATTIPNACGI
jgi:hypothetical protein